MLFAETDRAVLFRYFFGIFFRYFFFRVLSWFGSGPGGDHPRSINVLFGVLEEQGVLDGQGQAGRQASGRDGDPVWLDRGHRAKHHHQPDLDGQDPHAGTWYDVLMTHAYIQKTVTRVLLKNVCWYSRVPRHFPPWGFFFLLFGSEEEKVQQKVGCIVVGVEATCAHCVDTKSLPPP